ncbi:MAG: hypothetical protein AAFN78_12400 [Pseudomonadota bacterium]
MQKLFSLFCLVVIIGLGGFVLGMKTVEKADRVQFVENVHTITAADTRILLQIADGIRAGDPNKAISDIERALSTNASTLRDYANNPRLSKLVRLHLSEKDAAELDDAVEEALEALGAYSVEHGRTFDE